MKTSFKFLALLPLALAMTPLVSNASNNFATGDLAVVFYSATGSGPSLALESQYFIFNLGPASLYRENTQNDVPVSSINNLINADIATDLAAVFGPSWASAGTVRMFVTTTIPGSAANLVNGDPAVTNYFSVPRTTLNNGQTGATGVTFPNTSSLSLRNGWSGETNDFLYTGTNSAIAQTAGYINSNPIFPAPQGNSAGVRLPMVGNLINLSQYVPPAKSTYFRIGTNPAAIFGAGTISGTAEVEGAVAMFRVLNSLQDTTSVAADLTSGSTNTNATIGSAQYIGTLSINSAGILKVQSAGAVAAAANFATWATANGVTGGVNGDSDNDGIPNSIEYALATNLTGSDGSVGTLLGGTLAFNKRAAAVTNGDVTYQIEESDDLGIADAWQVMTPTSNTPTAITYALLPPGPAKKFARLKITIAP